MCRFVCTKRSRGGDRGCGLHTHEVTRLPPLSHRARKSSRNIYCPHSGLMVANGRKAGGGRCFQPTDIGTQHVSIGKL